MLPPSTTAAQGIESPSAIRDASMAELSNRCRMQNNRKACDSDRPVSIAALIVVRCSKELGLRILATNASRGRCYVEDLNAPIPAAELGHQ